jgi:hypothetical protein
MTDRNSELEKKRRFADVEVFAGDFTDGITEGFKMVDLYGDVTDSPFEMPTELSRNSNRNFHTVTCPVYRQNSRWNHRIYAHSADSLLPYFSFFFPILTLPYCKQPAPHPKKKIASSQHNKSYIFLEVLWSQHPCSDLPTDFISFCK